jgi:hypothetical protein
MPKFLSYKGMGPGKIIQEFNDKLHINGRVYRTSDLSEIVGKTAMNPHHSAGIASGSWSLRLKRGYQPATRYYNSGKTVYHLLTDFDMALCGNWAGVTTAGLFLDSTKLRQMLGFVPSNMVIDVDTETGAVTASETPIVFTSAGGQSNECSVFLPAGPGGTLGIFRNGDPSYGSAVVASYPAGNAAAGTATTVLGTMSNNSAAAYHYRINDNAQRWYFMGVQVATTAISTISVSSVLKTTLALTNHNLSLATPVGATALGANSLGYCNSIPSYASNSGVNELSSYILWRTATNMEIHRVQIASTDGTPVVTNNLVTLDQNPMTPHGNLVAATVTAARIQLVTHSDGNKYLLIFGLEVPTNVAQGAACTMYVYKLTDKNTAQFVGQYALAQGPRAYLASDDSGMRFVMVYDDRYEFWAFGAGGVLSKVDTVYVSRFNGSQYFHADPYGFDGTGRFWYLTADSSKPGTYTELGVNFYSPPGQVNTISVSFDSDNYTYSGAPVNGTLSVSVKDVTGAYVAAVVNLSPSVNIALQNSQVNTTTAGPTIVPFTINAPGDLSVDAWT